jgi:hypothetical protein
LKRLISSGFNDRPSGFFFVTSTAPGVDVLPWDPSFCSHKSGRPCSGKIGCRVYGADAAKWNGHAPQAWSWLVTEVRRLLPDVDVQFWKCWETQDRGMLHLHGILWALGVTEDRMRRVWAEALRHVYDVGGGYSFGWGSEQSCDRIGSKLNVEELMEILDPPEVMELLEADESKEKAKFVRYGAKYCTKGGERAATINRTTGEIRRDGSGYRTWSASARWGHRMKAIKAQQRAWAAEAAAQATAALGPAAGAEGALDPDSDFYATVELLLSVFDAVEVPTGV